LAATLDYVLAGDCLVVSKLDRLGLSLPHLLEIVTGLEAEKVRFRSLTEHVDITTLQGTFLFSVFGGPRTNEGRPSAHHGRTGGCVETWTARRTAIDSEQLEMFLSALANAANKAAACRNFGGKRTTLHQEFARTSGD